MIRKGRAILFALLALSLTIPLHAADVPTSFTSTHYYILSLGEMSVDLATLVQTAQSAGYSIIQYEGDVASVRRDGEDVADGLSVALADETVLVVDSGRFYLRENSATYTFTVRPAESGYDLVINPAEDLSINETLTSVLMGLQQLGIHGNDVNLEFTSFAKADLKGPASPTGVPIDSTVYGLTVAEDWFGYATANNLTQVGLRVEIVAEKIPGSTLSSEFSDYVIEESETLVKLLLPIDELLTLAQSTSIGYVRIAYEPSVP